MNIRTIRFIHADNGSPCLRHYWDEDNETKVMQYCLDDFTDDEMERITSEQINSVEEIVFNDSKKFIYQG